ncbi:MAG: hypothetical protein E6Q97_19865 [Desulfurellales bacterium]|nr:MAG: hypothetical protein E6Q97_19865 [Desulfurellales bacterium]
MAGCTTSRRSRRTPPRAANGGCGARTGLTTVAEIIKVEIRGLTGVLDALKSLPPEIVSKRGGPVRASLRAAANVLRDQAKANVARIIAEPNIDGDNRSTGLLHKSIQTKRSKLKQGVNGEAFVVGIRRGQKYPANRQARKEAVTAVQVGRLLEYGTEKRKPMPWLRPAFDAKGSAALARFSEEMQKRTTAAIKKAEKLAAAKANQP